jgi:Ca2+-binding RTX toxin-like protein
MALNSASAPSGNFDLSNWKITLPVDQNGTFGGTAVEVKSLSGYQHSEYFYTANDGAMVFNAPVDGATTSGSKYARSELREMKGTDKAAWNLSQGGFMSATLEVDQVPTLFGGAGGKIVIGQIHGQDDELVYFKNDQAGSSNSELRFDLTNASGQKADISIDEKFSYSINAKGDYLDVNVYADGQTYTSHTKINDVWDNDSFYFKAGAYLGVNESQGSGTGQTSFYSLSFNHDGTVTEPAPTPTPTPTPIPTPTPTPTPDSPSTPSTAKTIKGTSSSNVLSGKSSNDAIYGYGGDDRLYGKNGNDVLTGGAGKDSFVFDTTPNSQTNVDVITDFNVKDDTIRLNDTAFTKLKWGNLASSSFVVGEEAKDANDYIIYNDGTGALLYDADGSGGGAAVQFAKIAANLSVTAADFIVI